MKYKYNGEWKEISVKVSDTLPIGAVIEYAGSKAPTNWLFVGTEVKITDYPELYDVIGDTFNDENTPEGYFKAYNKKGLVTVGVDSTDTDFDTIGKTSGEKTHKLTINQIPSHGHPDIIVDATQLQWNLKFQSGNNQMGLGAVEHTGNIIKTGNAGGNQAHNNLQPYVVSNFIVKARQSIGVVGKVLDEKSDSKKDTYNCDYINKLHTYSTSPVKIGTSDNGKDRYRIIVIGNTPAETGWVAIKQLPNNLKIKKMNGILSDYLPIPCYINSEYNINVQYNKENGNLFCMVNGYTNAPFELTIEYETE